MRLIGFAVGLTISLRDQAFAELFRSCAARCGRAAGGENRDDWISRQLFSAPRSQLSPSVSRGPTSARLRGGAESCHKVPVGCSSSLHGCARDCAEVCRAPRTPAQKAIPNDRPAVLLVGPERDLVALRRRRRRKKLVRLRVARLCSIDGRVARRRTPRLVHDGGASAWCLMKVRDLLKPNAIGEPSGSGVTSRRLCIVCRDRHLSGEFVAVFTTALGLREEFEIIIDRRRGDPPTDPPPADRRCRPNVTRALERDGFAIVAPFDTRPVQSDHLKLPQVPGTPPIERLALKEADERQLERILGFKRRRSARLRRRLILVGLIGAMPTMLMLSSVGKTLMSRTRPAKPPFADEMNAAPIVEKPPHAAETHGPRPGPAVTDTPLPNPEVRVLQRDGRRESPGAGRPRDADTMRRSVPGPSVHEPATAVPAPSVTDPPRTGVALKDPSPQVRLPQADLTRNPAPASEGGGEAYAVRLSDLGGRPLAGAEVLLLIRVTDGTLLEVPLGAGPNLGTYSVTMPPLQSAPVDLRLRVVTNNTRVEIPLTP